MKISVGIVDDLWTIVKALSDLLNNTAEFEMTFTANDCKDMMKQLDAGKKPPAYMLVDTDMILNTGVEAVHYLHRFFSSMECIVFSPPHSTPDQRALMIEAGCIGCISKVSSPSDIIKQLNTLMKHETIKGNEEDIVQAYNLTHNNLYKFSTRQLEVIQLICMHKTNQEIADTLLRSSSTVEGWITGIFKIFGVKNRKEMILKAIEMRLYC